MSSVSLGTAPGQAHGTAALGWGPVPWQTDAGQRGAVTGAVNQGLPCPLCSVHHRHCEQSLDRCMQPQGYYLLPVKPGSPFLCLASNPSYPSWGSLKASDRPHTSLCRAPGPPSLLSSRAEQGFTPGQSFCTSNSCSFLRTASCTYSGPKYGTNCLICARWLFFSRPHPPPPAAVC